MKKSVPPQGHSPSVPRNAKLPQTKHQGGEKGRAKPAGLGKVKKTRGN